MFGSLTGDDIFNQVLMQRQLDLRTVVLLEGIEDLDALTPHIDESAATPTDSAGKKNVLRAMTLLNAARIPGVLGIVDRDFDGMISPNCVEPNVYYTDESDLDTTVIFAGSVLQRILRNYTNSEKYTSDLSASGDTAEDRLIAVAHPVGVLRKYSVENGLKLSLKRFPVHVVIRNDGKSVDVGKMCTIATSRSPDCHADAAAIEAGWRAEFPLPFPPRQYLRGHDLAGALKRLCKHWGGGLSGSLKDIESMARATFAMSDLQTTALYAEVDAWSTRTGYRVWV